MDCWSLVNGGWVEGEVASAEAWWFNILNTGAPEAAHLAELASRFGLHPLAVEDCISPYLHAPKIDEFGDNLFVVLQAIVAGDDGPELAELDAFLAPRYLITYAETPIPGLADVVAALRNGLGVRPGSDGLFHAIADRTVDAVLPQVHAMAEQLEAIESQALARPGDARLQQGILALRSRAGHIRRVFTSELTVIQRLSRGEFAEIRDENRIYFRDIYDHLVRIDLALENIREDAEVVLGTYLSAVNNRLSEVMKVLSIVAALALPATVISGVFGTNFDNVPGLHSNWGFAAMMAATVGVMGGMATYFWRRGWF